MTEPAWMAIARREVGVRERPGLEHHPRILEYLAVTRLPPRMMADETPWCAAFVGWCLEQAGIRSTRSAAARSYESWGVPIDVPRPGAIAVFSRPTAANPRSGHVAFYAGLAGDKIRVLGGNQNNAVCVRPYSEDRLIGFRWPSEP